MGDSLRLDGPSYQWTRKMIAKAVSRQLTPAESHLYEGWIAMRRTLQRILAEMEETLAKVAEILLRQAQNTAGS